jgi:hypothetical protein
VNHRAREVAVEHRTNNNNNVEEQADDQQSLGCQNFIERKTGTTNPVSMNIGQMMTERIPAKHRPAEKA